MSEINSSAPVLDKLLPLRSSTISSLLASHYKLSHLSLANTLDELATVLTFDELGPSARLIAQGRAYAVFKQMFKAQLMTKTQASEYLRYYQLDSDNIRMLNQVRFLKVPIIET